MGQVCPSCGAIMGAVSTHCSSCGAEVDPYLTIQPPKFHGATAPKPQPAPAPRRAPEPEPERHPAPAPRPKPKPKVPRPAAPPAASAQPAAPPRRPAPPYAAPAAPPITPPTPPPPVASYQPPPAPWPGPPPAAPGQPPGGIRKKLIEMLGGRAAGAPEPAAYPHPYGPPPVAPPEAHRWPPQAPPMPRGDGGYPPAAYAPAPPPAYAPAPPPPPPMPFDVPAEPGDDDGLTRFMQGPDLAKLKIPTTLYTLQILDRNGQWQPWSTIGTGGLKVGRTERSSQFPELNSMATKHLRLSYDGTRLLAEDQGTLNGVYLRLVEPAELHDGSRFRVGGHVLEFHAAEAPSPAEALKSEDGEEFWCGDLVPLAYLDFIRPDGSRGVRVPLTHPEPTILGRGSRPGKPVTLPLPADDWVSGQHAQVRHDAGRFWLEDLRSRNGTFLRTSGPTPVKAGDILLCGRVLLKVADSAGH